MTNRPVYGTFQLDTLNDEEQLRYVLSIIPLPQLYRLALHVKEIERLGRGEVAMIIRNGKYYALNVTTNQKVNEV